MRSSYLLAGSTDLSQNKHADWSINHDYKLNLMPLAAVLKLGHRGFNKHEHCVERLDFKASI